MRSYTSLQITYKNHNKLDEEKNALIDIYNCGLQIW